MLLSVAAVVQSLRELWLWERDGAEYTEQSYLELPIIFAGHTLTVVDDQPRSSRYSEDEQPGTIRLLLDGVPLGVTSRAQVRPGRHDLGRYHRWLDVWQFRRRTSGDSALWIARRLQDTPKQEPRFEVFEVMEGGVMRHEQLRGWQLSSSYPLFRATQFVRWENLLYGVPLSVLDWVAYPPLLLVFPLGTFALGTVLVWRGRASKRVAA